MKTSSAAKTPASNTKTPPAPLERFERNFAHAIGGLASQFEQPALGTYSYLYDRGKAERARSRELVRRAWMLAADAEELFEERETVETFNESLE